MKEVGPLISVLVVAYNSRALIERCLTRIFAAARATQIEVLLIDNGQDGTAGLVADKFPEVRVIPSRGNIGFAAANNALAEEATGPYLLLVNPDLFLKEDAIDALVLGARRHPEASAWGGVTLDHDGMPDTGNAIAIPSLSEFASAAAGRSITGARRSREFDGDCQTDVLCGGLVMISRDVWVAAEGMDEAFFLYSEEVDFFVRLRASGHEIYRIGDARGEHLIAHGGNLSPSRLMFKTAGTMQFMRKHWSLPKCVAGGILIWIAAMGRYLAGKLLGRWKPRLAKLGQAHSDVAFRPQRWWHGYDSEKGYKAWLDRQE